MAAAPASTRRRRALLVASGTYADAGLARLRAPAGDVDALAGVLGDGSIGGFEVRELVDRPTDEVKRAIEGFFAEARPDDLLLLYFSGHGVLSQSRRFYFATATTALSTCGRPRSRTASSTASCTKPRPHDRPHPRLLPQRRVREGPDAQERPDGRRRAPLRGPRAVTLSASTELEYAFEEADPATGINELAPSAPGSLFTSCLVDGLRSGEADVDEDGVISVDELYDYVCDRVRERSPHQTPGMAGDRRGDIVIARSPRGARRRRPPRRDRRRRRRTVRPPPRSAALARVGVSVGSGAAVAGIATAVAAGMHGPPGSAPADRALRLRPRR